VGPHPRAGYSTVRNFVLYHVVKVQTLKNGYNLPHASKIWFFHRIVKSCGKICHAVRSSFDPGSLPRGSPGQGATFIQHHFLSSPLCRVPYSVFIFASTLLLHCFGPLWCRVMQPRVWTRFKVSPSHIDHAQSTGHVKKKIGPLLRVQKNYAKKLPWPAAKRGIEPDTFAR